MIKKLVMPIFLISLVLCVPVFAEEPCTLAYPMMEVVLCEKADSFTQNLQFKCEGSDCTSTYTCISDCTFNVIVDCGMLSEIRGNVIVNGELRADLSKFISVGGKVEVHGEKAGDGESIVVTATCARLFITYPVVTSKSYVSVHDFNKFLYATNHEWSKHKLINTPNCIPQDRLKNFINKQIKSGNLPDVYMSGGTDALGNSINTYQNEFTDISSLNLENEMKVGDTFSYFYRWEDVSDINLKYDIDKEPVYCGGSSDNRKLISYNTLTTDEGCYYVPSGIKREVECCLDGDCRFTGEICGPGFECTDKKPCNGIYDCGTEEPQCLNNQKLWWTCDTSEGGVNLPNGETYNGWCKKNAKTVKCCPGTCPPNQHCEEDKGCVSDIRIIECPPGKCCSPGGSYRVQVCPSNLKCCPTSNPILGECEESCEPPKPESSNADVEPAQTTDSGFQTPGIQSLSTTGMNISQVSGIVGIVGLIIAAILISLYFTVIRKSKLTKKGPGKKKIAKSETGFCPYCGSKLEKDDLFCPECGGKV